MKVVTIVGFLPLWASLLVAMHDVSHSIRSDIIIERNDLLHSFKSGRSILVSVVLLS